eukprot:Protomagalhaensia_sp_Gyna_25__171@NODE_1082_length_2210_cov_261_388761_g860_i0_p2_GENE_NODE_1082_length_2210_cov_261_388761_g860_i0NODE_1082_length_2210_cov_261_388761_g860_i0_p2_ORF_typecomplete_len251_score36_25Bax1I/PF01027_20/6e55BaxI_1/PF12811_7/1_1e07DUF1761/PF08570_10/0_04DUF1761/PF08570_10/2e02DUF1118/PF06549_12/0_44DUF1118/PF06549_12/1_6e04SPC25/PF06703_11/5_3e02SPC25/PF06703_11/0_94_NODE_1082_length_2210_cov_261_388761_g860_i065817
MSAMPIIGSDQFLDPESLLPDEKHIKSIRHGFIRKVYGILSFQIVLTTLVASVFTLSESWRLWILSSGSWLVALSMIMGLGVLCGLACIPDAAQKHPTNLYLLTAFTLAQSVGLGAVCAVFAANYGVSLILQAYVCTALVVIGLTLFAMQTKYDFTKANGILFSCLMGLVGFGLLRLLFPWSAFFETLYALLGAVLFSCYLVVDTQMLVGTHSLKVDEDQYIMVSLTLYVDIINLFLDILKLLAQSEDRQ